MLAHGRRDDVVFKVYGQPPGAIVGSTPGALGIVDVRAIQGTQVRVLKVDGKLPMEVGYLPH